MKEAHHPSVKAYLYVFAALAVLTVLTVWVAYLDLPRTAGVIVAAVIALAKVSLIGLFFMHLISEKMLIHGIWTAAVGLVLVLVFLVFPDLIR